MTVEQRNWVRFAKTSQPALSASALPASEAARLVRHVLVDELDAGSLSPVQTVEPALARQHARNNLPTMPAVDSKIGVGRQQHRIVHNLGHANKAGIRETHRHLGVFL